MTSSAQQVRALALLADLCGVTRNSGGCGPVGRVGRAAPPEADGRGQKMEVSCTRPTLRSLSLTLHLMTSGSVQLAANDLYPVISQGNRCSLFFGVLGGFLEGGGGDF